MWGKKLYFFPDKTLITPTGVNVCATKPCFGIAIVKTSNGAIHPFMTATSI